MFTGRIEPSPCSVRVAPEILLQMGRDAEAWPEAKLGPIQAEKDIRLAAKLRAVNAVAGPEALTETGHSAVKAYAEIGGACSGRRRSAPPNHPPRQAQQSASANATPPPTKFAH